METPCTCPDKGEAVLNPCPTHDAANVLELVLSNKVCVALCEVPLYNTHVHSQQPAGHQVAVLIGASREPAVAQLGSKLHLTLC